MSDATAAKKVAKKATAPTGEAPKKRGRPAGVPTGPRLSKGTDIILRIPLAELLKMDSPAVRKIIKKYL